ncbi:PilZ domain-containing protein [Idiomarina sp.]|uniref:PilZ domain-containing protein n=1 Tax=Idiomarina sp. TaxID=1874361 RepID=UPI0025BB4E96|nr:PilZ domain-containing protein [Idiomarina sp.]
MPNAHFEQLIEQLKPVVNEPDFDKIFRALTEGEDGPTRFQLKMELRRLASPCLLTVDLRNRVSGRCEPYDFLGRRHYLDEVAKDIFERGLRIYNGVFTQDTYEQILTAENNNRVIQEKEREQALERKNQHAERVATREEYTADDEIQSPYLVDTFHFGDYPYRAEERMNFSVEVRLEDDQLTSKKAITSDISVTGLRVRVDVAWQKKTGDKLNVYFTGLAKEFTLDPQMAIPYTIVAVQRQGDKTYLSLNRSSEFSSDSLDKFLKQFINGYKKRYRVNIDNTYHALMNKGHEQFLMPRLGVLPLYFAYRDKQLQADYVLTTDNNRHIIEDWINEHNQISIGSLFNPRRSAHFIKRLAEHPEASVTFLTFSITARGKIYYYSALAEELLKNDLWDTFVNFAAQKSSFRVYQFRLRKLDPEQAWQPQAVPLEVQIPFRLNPPSPRVKQALAPLNYLGTLTDVTDSMRQFAGNEFDKSQVKALKVFLHPPAVPIRTKDVRLEFVDLRKEQRFSYRSRCRLRIGKTIREGMILDLSVHGLKVQLDDAVDTQVNDTVLLSLTGFEKKHTKSSLRDIPYLVVNSDASKTTLNLKIPKPKTDDKKQSHAGAEFFQFLIKEHRDQLKLLHENTSLNGIELCLRNLYCAAPPSVPLYLYQNKKRQVTLRRAGVSSWRSGWARLLANLPGSGADNLNIQPVLRGSSLNTEILPPLQALSRSDRPLKKLLLVKLYQDQDESVLQTQWQTFDSLDTATILSFADQCLPDAVFFAVQVELSRTGRPDIQFVQAEMSYLSQYASHRANELEEELWQVYAVADTHDITAEVLKFADVSLENIKQQQQRLNSWLSAD